jgi:hypothetical protein
MRKEACRCANLAPKSAQLDQAAADGKLNQFHAGMDF